MRRDFNVLKGENGCEAGDDFAGSQATALAQMADGPTIEKLVQAVNMLDLFGGQLYIQAHRAKFDADGALIPDDQAKETPGRWETVGYVFRFETVDVSVMQGKGRAFTVPGPITPGEHDDVELAGKEAIADGLSETPADERPSSDNGSAPAPEPASSATEK